MLNFKLHNVAGYNLNLNNSSHLGVSIPDSGESKHKSVTLSRITATNMMSRSSKRAPPSSVDTLISYESPGLYIVTGPR